MKKKIVFSLLLLFMGMGIKAQTDDAYQYALKALFQMSGSESYYKEIIHRIFDVFIDENPHVDKDKMYLVKKEILDSALDDISELLTPVYQRHFSLSEIEELLAFYRSPIGRKYAETSQQILDESLMAGQRWGRELLWRIKESIDD